MSKSKAAAKQAERDDATAAMNEDKADDKKKRFEFLLNSASGDLFRKFVKSSDVTHTHKGQRKVRAVVGIDGVALS